MFKDYIIQVWETAARTGRKLVTTTEYLNQTPKVLLSVKGG